MPFPVWKNTWRPKNAEEEQRNAQEENERAERRGQYYQSDNPKGIQPRFYKIYHFEPEDLENEELLSLVKPSPRVVAPRSKSTKSRAKHKAWRFSTTSLLLCGSPLEQNFCAKDTNFLGTQPSHAWCLHPQNSHLNHQAESHLSLCPNKSTPHHSK